jgi:chemotaxis signal transduction protein
MSPTITPIAPLTSSELSQDSVRVITFTIANHQLALPMNAIVKVVSCPPSLMNSTHKVELLHFGNHSITVLNLHQHFAQASSGGKFLVVTRSKQEELYALMVDTPPDLRDLPVSAIRKLPESYRQGHPLSIASCVAVLPQSEGVLSVFIIDMLQAVAALHGHL